jgi:hypothetical protein
VNLRTPLSCGIFTVIACSAPLLLIVLWFAAAKASDPTIQRGPEVDESTFAKHLHRLAGPEATNCGYVRLNRDFSAAVKCRNNALDDRDPFLYAYKTPSMRWWIGLAMDRAGKAWLVEFDHEFPPGRGSIRVSP